jgi:alanine racemase
MICLCVSNRGYELFDSRVVIHCYTDLLTDLSRWSVQTMDFVPYNRLEISKSALLNNIESYERISGQSVIPVLKGNAYGHGIEIVARVLKEKRLSYIAVNEYYEALRIRNVSDQPVLILGSIRPEDFPHIQYKDFTFIVHDEAIIHALGKTSKPIKVHLECNVDMNRYGAKPHEIAHLTKLIASYRNLRLEGVMGHLADSDGYDSETVNAAVARFDACVDTIRATGASPHILHIAQSAGSLKAQSRWANFIRLGIGLYGINPFPYNHDAYKRLKDLRPAHKLVSTITKIIELEKGDKVGYNYTFTAPKRMTIGVIPIGYYEGLCRDLSNVGVVKIGKIPSPITGRVCMHYTMISLDGIYARVGDEVTVYSDVPTDPNSIDAVTKKHDLFGYGLLAALNGDLHRVLVP